MTKSLDAFCEETAAGVEDVKAVDIAYLDFCNAFDSVSLTTYPYSQAQEEWTG